MQGTGPYSAFVDANVWFSRTLRDWLGMLYTVPESPPFVVYWTEDVLAELIYHLRKKNPSWPGDRITGIRDQLAGTFEAGRVERFEVDPTYGGRDPGDAHVHAAAVACRADVLVTCNANDFEWSENTSPYEVMTRTTSSCSSTTRPPSSSRLSSVRCALTGSGAKAKRTWEPRCERRTARSSPNGCWRTCTGRCDRAGAAASVPTPGPFHRQASQPQRLLQLLLGNLLRHHHRVLERHLAPQQPVEVDVERLHVGVQRDRVVQ